MPKPLHEYSEATRLLIPEYGRVLALADVYDALHRVNSRFGDKRQLADDEIKEKMLEFNPDRKDLIMDLYNADIFIRQMEEEVPTELYEQAWAYDHTLFRTPSETARQIMIATALEPLSDKPGCTTRSSNVSRHLKLEYFIVGGINLGDAFAALAQRIIHFGFEQKQTYDLALRAQREPAQQRRGTSQSRHHRVIDADSSCPIFF